VPFAELASTGSSVVNFATGRTARAFSHSGVGMAASSAAFSSST